MPLPRLSELTHKGHFTLCGLYFEWRWKPDTAKPRDLGQETQVPLSSSFLIRKREDEKLTDCEESAEDTPRGSM